MSQKVESGLFEAHLLLDFNWLLWKNVKKEEILPARLAFKSL